MRVCSFYYGANSWSSKNVNFSRTTSPGLLRRSFSEGGREREHTCQTKRATAKFASQPRSWFGGDRRIFFSIRIFEHLLGTFRAHAVRGVGGEFGAEIFFHRQPLIMITHLAAPAADAEKFLEVVQALQQPPGDPIDPGPDEQNDDGPEDGTVPVGRERFAKNQVGDVKQLRQPGKDDHQRKADGLIPKDGIRLHVQFCFPWCHKIKSVRQKIFSSIKAAPSQAEKRSPPPEISKVSDVSARDRRRWIPSGRRVGIPAVR
jgi:hypothetical protein